MGSRAWQGSPQCTEIAAQALRSTDLRSHFIRQEFCALAAFTSQAKPPLLNKLIRRVNY